MDLITRLAAEITRLAEARDRVLVAIDGPDAAGKTTLARGLVENLSTTTTSVISASVDDFQRARQERRSRGRMSSDGYYLNGFDHDALVSLLLKPFAVGATSVVTTYRDLATDRIVTPAPVAITSKAVLVVDGVFLQMPVLRDYWSLVVYLDVPSEVSRHRGVARDMPVDDEPDLLNERYLRRYLPAQARYRAEVDPVARADIVIDNTDPLTSVVLRWPALG